MKVLLTIVLHLWSWNDSLASYGVLPLPMTSFSGLLSSDYCQLEPQNLSVLREKRQQGLCASKFPCRGQHAQHEITSTWLYGPTSSMEWMRRSKAFQSYWNMLSTFLLVYQELRLLPRGQGQAKGCKYEEEGGSGKSSWRNCIFNSCNFQFKITISHPIKLQLQVWILISDWPLHLALLQPEA